MQHYKTSTPYTTAILMLVLFIGAASAYYYAKQRPTPNLASRPIVAVPSSTPMIVKGPFQYTVKSITSDVLVFSGDTGDMYVPNDTTTKIRYSDDQAPATISALPIGRKVDLAFIPGQKTIIYVSR